jgi:hypothetical protein
MISMDVRPAKPIIQSLWIGSQLSVIERLSVSSFIKNGHEFHLYVYNDIRNLPEGTTVKDANTVLPESAIFQGDKGSYASFSDWFRHKLLYKHGGFWSDMDVVCLKYIDLEDDIVFALESQTLAGTSFFKFPPGHYICGRLAKSFETGNKIQDYDNWIVKTRKCWRKLIYGKKANLPAKTGWGDLGGPLGFTNILKHEKLFHLKRPTHFFYPIPWRKWYQIFFEDKFDLRKIGNSYTVHLWNEMMRRKSGFDKNAVFGSDTLIEYLKRKYL